MFETFEVYVCTLWIITIIIIWNRIYSNAFRFTDILWVNSPVNIGFPEKESIRQSFYANRLPNDINKPLNEPSNWQWSGTLWRACDVIVVNKERRNIELHTAGCNIYGKDKHCCHSFEWYISLENQMGIMRPKVWKKYFSNILYIEHNVLVQYTSGNHSCECIGIYLLFVVKKTT